MGPHQWHMVSGTRALRGGPIYLAWRAGGIVPVAVLLSNPAILVVYDKFGFLIATDDTSSVDCFSFRRNSTPLKALEPREDPRREKRRQHCIAVVGQKVHRTLDEIGTTFSQGTRIESH